VFNRTVHDWDAYARKVVELWSCGMLGTTRYHGQPFSAHLSLGLRPEHFQVKGSIMFEHKLPGHSSKSRTG
jgi:hemoglobin